MKFSKQQLETLYRSMSIGSMAAHLGIARSTLYYHMRKLGVIRRSKSQAQQQHLETSHHQRKGKTHSDETKEKISEGTRRFWDSSDGKRQKEHLGLLRREEWDQRSAKDRRRVLHRLQSAERPSPGKLSRFGKKLVTFLEDREDVTSGITLTPGHVSDIILTSHKVVIELLLPIAVYGDEQKQKIEIRYDRLVNQLNDVGYRVIIVEDRSNAISQARCQRVYDQLLKFFDNKTLQRMDIVS